MATSYSPKVNTDGLIMCVDFANPKSYPSGSTVVTDMARQVTGSLSVFAPLRVDSGRGLHFTQNQYLQIPTNHASLTNATFIVWVNLPTASLNLSRVFWGTTESGSWAYQAMGINAQGILYAFQGNGITGPNPTVTSSINISDNSWHMVSFQYSVGDKLYLFVDTQKITGPAFSNKGLQGVSSVIGADYNTSNAISGSIGTVMWYNRVLTDAEIQQNYNAMRGRFGV